MSNFSTYFWEKKNTRKYHKRKKNIFQKIQKKISIFTNVPPKMFASISIFWIVLAIVFLLFYSPYTSISKINVYREWWLIDINRAYDQLDYLRWKNILSIDNASIAERLQKSQSSISQIRINKDFPNTININLNSYKIAFQTEKDFILANGSITPKENESFPDARFIYLSEDTWEYIDFQKKLSVPQLTTIEKIINESTKNILGFNPVEIYYYIKERELIIKDSNWTLYIFDLEQDVNTQIRRLAIYRTESWEIKTNSNTYVDVRIPDKIFVCSREEESTCNNNLEQIYSDIIFQSPPQEVSESPL